MKANKKSRDDLLREIKELESQIVYMLHSASEGLHKFSVDRMMGSGVVLELTALGGKLKIAPVLIRDGLSKDTILCLQKDLMRSYEVAVAFKPKGV